MPGIARSQAPNLLARVVGEVDPALENGAAIEESRAEGHAPTVDAVQSPSSGGGYSSTRSPARLVHPFQLPTSICAWTSQRPG